MLWIIEYILSITLFNHLAKIHKDDVIGNTLSLSKCVSDHDY